MQNLVVVVFADEWTSGKGGISTFNRRLCKAFALAGHRVICILLSGRGSQDNVTLVGCDPIAGADELSLLMRPPRFGTPGLPKPDIVVGHGHITGPAASVFARDYDAKFLYIIHTQPEDIERYKERDEEPGKRTDRREKTDTELCRQAAAVAAVGPRLNAYAKRLFRENQLQGEPVGIMPFMESAPEQSSPPDQPRFIIERRQRN